jgi:hypothetical protein
MDLAKYNTFGSEGDRMSKSVKSRASRTVNVLQNGSKKGKDTHFNSTKKLSMDMGGSRCSDPFSNDYQGKLATTSQKFNHQNQKTRAFS